MIWCDLMMTCYACGNDVNKPCNWKCFPQSPSDEDHYQGLTSLFQDSQPAPGEPFGEKTTVKDCQNISMSTLRPVFDDVHNWLVSILGHWGRKLAILPLSLLLPISLRTRSDFTRKTVGKTTTVVRPRSPSRTKRHFFPKKIFLETLY